MDIEDTRLGRYVTGEPEHHGWTPRLLAQFQSCIAAAGFRVREEKRPPIMIVRGLIGDLQRLLSALEEEHRGS